MGVLHGASSDSRKCACMHGYHRRALGLSQHAVIMTLSVALSLRGKSRKWQRVRQSSYDMSYVPRPTQMKWVDRSLCEQHLGN